MDLINSRAIGHGGAPAPAEAPVALRWLDAFERWSAGPALWRQRALACAAGAASVLAMAPFHLWPVLWVTLPVLCVLAEAGMATSADTGRWQPWRRTAFGRAAETGWWFGFGYHLAGLFWVGEAFLVEADVFAWLMPFAVTLLPAGLALFFAAATGVLALQPGWSPFERSVALAISLGLAEWLRGHVLTGFPWNVLGYALTAPLPLMQSAAVFGIYGLTVITVLVFAGPLALLRGSNPRSPRRATAKACALAVLPLTVMALAGLWRLHVNPPAPPQAKTIRLVQPSIPQRQRLQAANQRAIFDQHLALSLTAPDGTPDNAAGIALIIWPEAAMPFVPLAQPVALAEIGRMLPTGTPLLSGALRLQSDPVTGRRQVYNSLLAFTGAADGARLLAHYDKVHLVPFGEYLPAQTVLEAIGLQQLTRQRGGFTAGDDAQTLLTVAGLKILPLICYEAIFPHAPVADAERPGLLLTITNDGWFGNTTGPRQHYHQARVRAVEWGVPMIRASSNGISALIDGVGRERGRLELNAVGTLDVERLPSLPPTVYSSYGDKIFLCLVIALMLWLGWSAKKQQPLI